MTLRTFNSLDIRITLKVGFNRLTVGRIERQVNDSHQRKLVHDESHHLVLL